jgi:hypothetical protein
MMSFYNNRPEDFSNVPKIDILLVADLLTYDKTENLCSEPNYVRY